MAPTPALPLVSPQAIFPSSINELCLGRFRSCSLGSQLKVENVSPRCETIITDGTDLGCSGRCRGVEVRSARYGPSCSSQMPVGHVETGLWVVNPALCDPSRDLFPVLSWRLADQNILEKEILPRAFTAGSEARAARPIRAVLLRLYGRELYAKALERYSEGRKAQRQEVSAPGKECGTPLRIIVHIIEQLQLVHGSRSFS